MSLDWQYDAYEAADPYFDLVRGALGDLVEGKHFFDILADDVVYEVLYDFPGWPRVIRGRAELMAAFRGYVDSIALHSADQLIIHNTEDGHVVVIEYEVHGTILATGAKYDNRFCSIIRIENRKISHWRDYMDSLAAWNTLMAGARGKTAPPEVLGNRGRAPLTVTSLETGWSHARISLPSWPEHGYFSSSSAWRTSRFSSSQSVSWTL